MIDENHIHISIRRSMHYYKTKSNLIHRNNAQPWDDFLTTVDESGNDIK